MIKPQHTSVSTRHLNPIRFKPITPFIKVHSSRRQRLTENPNPGALSENKNNQSRKINSIAILDCSDYKQDQSRNEQSFNGDGKYQRYFQQLLNQNEKLLRQIDLKDRHIEKLTDNYQTIKEKHDKLLERQRKESFNEDSKILEDFICQSQGKNSFFSRSSGQSRERTESLRKLKGMLEGMDFAKIKKIASRKLIGQKSECKFSSK